jgi:hypothetical protein
MKKWILIFGLCLLLSPIFVIAVETDDQIEIDFFWTSGCSACGQMKIFLEELSGKYDIKINSYESSLNSDLFMKKLDEYHVPLDKRGYVPTIFIEENFFIGYSNNIASSIESILLGNEKEFNLDDEIVSTKVLGFLDFEFSLENRSLLGTGFILAFFDSINVCSITVLIFLIVFSLSMGSAKRSFKIGLVFTFVIFVFYILFMILLSSFLGMFVLQYGVIIKIGVIAISSFAGILLIKDFFWYGKGISLSIPKSAKPVLEKYIQKATIGSTIILGILASLVELPCTAIFPLIYTTILAESGVIGLQKITYIIFYNLIYIWPLLFIVFATYFSWMRIERVDEIIQRNKRWMRLISGIALLIIALYFAMPLITR